MRGSVEFKNRIIDGIRRGRENIKGKIAYQIACDGRRVESLFQESRGELCEKFRENFEFFFAKKIEKLEVFLIPIQIIQQTRENEKKYPL